MFWCTNCNGKPCINGPNGETSFRISELAKRINKTVRSSSSMHLMKKATHTINEFRPTLPATFQGQSDRSIRSVNPITKNASLDYKKAEGRGYFKIDLLNVNVYKNIKSEKELVELMITEPDWEMLKNSTIVDQLFHLNGHYDIVSKLEPKNIEQLAAVLAIIRPAKRGLMYKNWVDILKEVWIKPTDGSYFFKKSHAVAYAHAIVVQMNLIKKDKYSFSATKET